MSIVKRLQAAGWWITADLLELVLRRTVARWR
jgi:hypothetical protein